jgi:DNA-binding transcriptional LysR family regulator
MFVAAVDAGSLAAAARKLGCSPASVTRAVAQLEATSGERLLERSTRNLFVTDAGSRHVGSYRMILNELAHLERRNEDVEITGNVVITAPELFGRIHVMPVVEGFLKHYPRTQVRLLLLNRMVDLIGEGVDVAIRLANLPDSSLIASKLGEVRKLICAAPSYIDANGSPRHPSDIMNYSCIGLNAEGVQELWQYRDPGTKRLHSVRVACRLTLNSAAAAIDAAERGLGLVRPMSYQVERQIMDGTLTVLLPDYEVEPLSVQMVFPSRKGSQRAQQAFIDYARPLLAAAIRSRLTQTDEQGP